MYSIIGSPKCLAMPVVFAADIGLWRALESRSFADVHPGEIDVDEVSGWYRPIGIFLHVLFGKTSRYRSCLHNAASFSRDLTSSLVDRDVKVYPCT